MFTRLSYFKPDNFFLRRVSFIRRMLEWKDFSICLQSKCVDEAETSTNASYLHGLLEIHALEFFNISSINPISKFEQYNAIYYDIYTAKSNQRRSGSIPIRSE